MIGLVLALYAMVGAGIGLFVYDKMPEEMHKGDRGARIFCGVVIAFIYPVAFGYQIAEWLLLEDADK